MSELAESVGGRHARAARKVAEEAETTIRSTPDYIQREVLTAVAAAFLTFAEYLDRSDT